MIKGVREIKQVWYHFRQIFCIKKCKTFINNLDEIEFSNHIAIHSFFWLMDERTLFRQYFTIYFPSYVFGDKYLCCRRCNRKKTMYIRIIVFYLLVFEGCPNLLRFFLHNL